MEYSGMMIPAGDPDHCSSLGACDFAQIMAAFKILCVYIHNIYIIHI